MQLASLAEGGREGGRETRKGGREMRKEGGEEVNSKLLDTDRNPKFWVIQQNVASLFLVFYRLEELL